MRFWDLAPQSLFELWPLRLTASPDRGKCSKCRNYAAWIHFGATKRNATPVNQTARVPSPEWGGRIPMRNSARAAKPPGSSTVEPCHSGRVEGTWFAEGVGALTREAA